MIGKGEITIFHNSVTGYSHTRKGTGCQDASDQYCSPDGAFRIIAVADGHGDQTCVRSDRGSSFAVSAAIECLQDFGDHYEGYRKIEEENYGRLKKETAIRQLTNAILSQWSRMVSEDLENDPLSEEEYEAAGDFAEEYSKGNNTERIYGTTLAAVIAAKDYCLLIQQGDGICDAIYKDGRMSAPLPEDDRCYGHVTTSMSDTDAAERIRGRIIHDESGDIIGLFTGTDGLANRFFSDSERHEFYMNLCRSISKQTSEKGLSELLTSSLKEVSLNGNGDDVSWAGIFDAESLNQYAQSFLRMLEDQRETEKNRWYQDQLQEIEEELELLRDRCNNSRSEDKPDWLEKYAGVLRRYNELKAKGQ